MPDTLVLASASPRRAELLTAAGYSFIVDPADADESILPGEAAEAYVARIATVKAAAVRARHDSSMVVLAADTTVVAGSTILGKPESEEDARAMLRLLSAGVHEVLTGVTILRGDQRLSDVARTRVHFFPLSEHEIDWYVGTGEPMGKAGAYGIQGRAARFIDWIDGSW